jgi:outer membrane lipoprotein
MKWLKGITFLLAGVLGGCSVMSPSVEQAAVPLTFQELVDNTAPYIGQSVIMGGYVLSVENLEDSTRIVALQTPLGAGQNPKSKDLSQGRLILIHPGFLDPEVYTKDRKITVGGTLSGSSTIDQDAKTPYPYLKIQVTEIHLWPVEKPVPPYPYPYPYWDYPYWDNPWYPYYYPWGWRHPHGWRHR